MLYECYDGFFEDWHNDYQGSASDEYVEERLSDEAQKKKRAKKLVANLILFNKFVNNAIAIQCLSARELAATRFGKAKFVATNGIYIPMCRKENFRKSDFRFLFIGRLDIYHKGIDLMLEAVTLSVEKMRRANAKVYLYGPDFGGKYAEVEALIHQKNISDVVVINHEIEGAEKEAALLQADVFIQTSRFEGMPMGILEAMSYGLPCLVTEGTTLSDFVEKNNAGWSCATDATEIARTIERAIQQKDRFAEKSNNAREAVCRNFSWDIVASKTVETYMQIINSDLR